MLFLKLNFINLFVKPTTTMQSKQESNTSQNLTEMAILAIKKRRKEEKENKKRREDAFELMCTKIIDIALTRISSRKFYTEFFILEQNTKKKISYIEFNGPVDISDDLHHIALFIKTDELICRIQAQIERRKLNTYINVRPHSNFKDGIVIGAYV